MAFDGRDNPRDLDGLGEHLSSGHRVGFGIKPGDPRERAIAIARLFDTMGMPRELLVDRVDVYPLRATPETLRQAVAVAEMLVNDAGDL